MQIKLGTSRWSWFLFFVQLSNDSHPFCQAEVYADRVACCPLVSHGEYADVIEGWTDGLTLDRFSAVQCCSNALTYQGSTVRSGPRFSVKRSVGKLLTVWRICYVTAMHTDHALFRSLGLRA